MKLTKSTTKLVYLALLVALMLVLGFTNLGLIIVPFSPLKITTLHIPVIIGACLMGPATGGFLGGVFGLISFINNSFIAPTITSFVFTPFYSIGDYSGNFWSLVICFVPRILVGVFAGLLYRWFTNRNKPVVGATVAGIAGALTNTILVLGGIALFFGNQYATVKDNTLMAIIMGSVIANGIPEAIVSSILTAVIVKPLTKIYRIKS